MEEGCRGPSQQGEESAGRKRCRSPPCPPIVQDYRPYALGLLQPHRRRASHKDQWDLYYRNNSVNGYKDRHYIMREFHELRVAIEAAEAMEEKEGEEGKTKTPESSGQPFSWMEAGCGVGNAILPVFQEYGHLRQWKALLGFDISSVAIELFKEKRAALPPHLAEKIHICVLNPSETDVSECSFFAKRKLLVERAITPVIPTPSPLCDYPNFVSLIFVLCSIPVASHAAVLRRIADCMHRGDSVLFFRDYAVSDHAEKRFQQSSRNVQDGCENTYERTNGTLSHFFTVDEVTELFQSVGFAVIEVDVVEREVVNHRTNVSFDRRFIQARFRLQEHVNSTRGEE